MKKIGLLLLCYGLGLLMARGQAMLPAGHYKYRVTHWVLSQVAAAFVEARPLPRLVMYAGSQRGIIAAFNRYPQPELALDEKLYDLCRSFGKDSLNALSLVIGHELTHFFRNHAHWSGWTQSAGSAPEADPVLLKESERQADKEGMFRAFIAGFSPFALVRPLMGSVYKAYRLPSQSSQYYPLGQRIAQAEASAAEARKFAHLYTLATFFFARQEYAYARQCWENVASEITYAEPLNNMGACQLLQAIGLVDSYEAPFRYPVEISAWNRLDLQPARGEPTQVKTLIREAIVHFTNAIKYPGLYPDAYINLATAYSLDGNQAAAVQKIDELEALFRAASRPLPANAHLVRGIAYVRDGKAGKAREDFEKTKGAYEEAYNLGVYRQYETFFASAPGKQKFLQWRRRYLPAPATAAAPERQLGGLTLPLPVAFSFSDHFNYSAPNVLRIRHARTGEADLFRVQLANKQVEVLRSLPSAKAVTARGLAVGDDLSRVRVLYGAPDRVVPAGAGNALYCYDQAQLYIEVRSNRVQHWMIFGEEK